jgi:hypothetical protein
LPLKLVPNFISESTANSIIAPSANFKGKGPVPVPEITFIWIIEVLNAKMSLIFYRV